LQNGTHGGIGVQTDDSLQRRLNLTGVAAGTNVRKLRLAYTVPARGQKNKPREENSAELHLDEDPGMSDVSWEIVVESTDELSVEDSRSGVERCAKCQ
jgi:hypothetical protein